MLNYVSMLEEFTTFIQQEMEIRGWSQADLARKTGLTTGGVSMLLNQTRKPSPDTLNTIARVLSYPPEQLFRLAGLLPPEYSEMIQKVIMDVNQKYPYNGEDISPAKKEQLFAYLVDGLLKERYNQLSMERLGVPLPDGVDAVIRDKAKDVVAAIELTRDGALAAMLIADKTSGSITAIEMTSPEARDKIKEMLQTRLESIIDKEQVESSTTEH